MFVSLWAKCTLLHGWKEKDQNHILWYVNILWNSNVNVHKMFYWNTVTHVFTFCPCNFHTIMAYLVVVMEGVWPRNSKRCTLWPLKSGDFSPALFQEKDRQTDMERHQARDDRTLEVSKSHIKINSQERNCQSPHIPQPHWKATISCPWAQNRMSCVTGLGYNIFGKDRTIIEVPPGTCLVPWTFWSSSDEVWAWGLRRSGKNPLQTQSQCKVGISFQFLEEEEACMKWR